LGFTHENENKTKIYFCEKREHNGSKSITAFVLSRVIERTSASWNPPFLSS